MKHVTGRSMSYFDGCCFPCFLHSSSFIPFFGRSPIFLLFIFFVRESDTFVVLEIQCVRVYT